PFSFAKSRRHLSQAVGEGPRRVSATAARRVLEALPEESNRTKDARLPAEPITSERHSETAKVAQTQRPNSHCAPTQDRRPLITKQTGSHLPRTTPFGS